MSEIDIEKKSNGVPWWAWLLGLLALAAIIWYASVAMSAKTPVTAVGVDNGAMVADDNGTMAPVADANVADTNMVDANAADTNMADANIADANMAPVVGTDTNTADMPMSNSTGNTSTEPAASGETITNILSVVDAQEPASLYNKKVKLLGAPVQAAGTKLFWIGPSFEQKMLVVTDANTNMNDVSAGVVQRDRLNIEGTIMEIKDFQEAKAKYNLDDNAITYLTNKKILLMATNVKRDKS